MEQPIDHLERLAALEAAPIGLQAAVPVFGMDALGPAFAGFLLERPAAEFEPGLVEEVAIAGLVGPPDQDGRLGDDPPEPGLGEGQIVFEALPIA